MNTYKHYATLLALSLLTLVGCSRESELQKEPTTDQEQATPILGPSRTLSLTIEAGLDQDDVARGIDGLTAPTDGLFPVISGKKVKAVLILANDKASHFAEIELNYDPDSKKVSYKGDIKLAESTLTGQPKVMLVAYPDGWYNAQRKSITVPAQFTQDPGAGKSIGIKVPYFTDWFEINVVKDPRIPTDAKGLVLKPQGQLLRLVIDDQQTEVSDTRLHMLVFETNVMSRSGAYNLSGISKVGLQPVYEPAASEILQNGHHYRHNIILSSAVSLKTAKTYYLWVTARPNVQKPYTRSFISVQYMDPVLDPSLNANDEGAWWSGKAFSDADDNNIYKLVVVGYNNNKLTAKGATYRFTLNNRNAFTPITRFSHYYMSAKSDDATVGQGYGELNPASAALLGNFKGRFYPGHARYSYSDLVTKRLAPDYYAQDLTSLRSPVYKNRGNGLSWRIPSATELLALLPSYNTSLSPATSRDIFAYKVANRNKVATVASESVVLGAKGTSAKNYSASYRYDIKDGAHLVEGIRFMDADNLDKCWYMYRKLGGGSQPDYTQVQASYLGKFYPEITTAAQWNSFKGIRPSLEERIIAWSNYYKDNDNSMLGNYIWVNDFNSSNNQFSRIKLDHSTGQVIRQNHAWSTASSTTATVVLIRDYK